MTEAISISESKRLIALEKTIEFGRQTFVEVGAALAEIRDSRLYRTDHDTFEDYCREKWGWEKAYCNHLVRAAEVVKSLPEKVATIVATETQARELVRVEPERRVEVLLEAKSNAEADGATITAKYIAEAARPHVSNNSGENEWYTPPKFIEAARKAMGQIDLDPASCELANKTVKAEKFYDMEADGLKKKWAGKVWMNPPYGQPEISDFCGKLVKEFGAKRISEACVLVNNATETAWFQDLAKCASAICFPTGRIKYLDKTGTPANTPLQGQAILYCGKNVSKFSAAFDDCGFICHL